MHRKCNYNDPYHRTRLSLKLLQRSAEGFAEHEVMMLLLYSTFRRYETSGCDGSLHWERIPNKRWARDYR